jgi:hypothetical protein
MITFREAFNLMCEGVILERLSGVAIEPDESIWVPYRFMPGATHCQLERYDTTNHKWVVSCADMGYLFSGDWRIKPS